jgi:hypothetical protein
MAVQKRSYRKKMVSYGLIYLGGEELEISVKNLSITGLLVELKGNDAIVGIEDVFHAIKISSVVDLYLPEMRLAGEAEITRADLKNERIYLALEFKNISYEVSDMLYKRKAYRKNMVAPGQIVFNRQKYHFFTTNVSVDGMTIVLKEQINISKGMVTIFDFKRLNLRGQVRVVWVDVDNEDNSTIMGLEYLNIMKEQVEGIPHFSMDQMKWGKGQIPD